MANRCLRCGRLHRTGIGRCKGVDMLAVSFIETGKGILRSVRSWDICSMI